MTQFHEQREKNGKYPVMREASRKNPDVPAISSTRRYIFVFIHLHHTFDFVLRKEDIKEGTTKRSLINSIS